MDACKLLFLDMLDHKFSGKLTYDRPVFKPPEVLDNRQGHPSTFLIGTDHSNDGRRRTIHPVPTNRAYLRSSYYSWNWVSQASSTTCYFKMEERTKGESSSHWLVGGCW